MPCTCGSTKIMSISGKCSDLFNLHFEETEIHGYVPYDLEIGGGDYIDMDICTECGRIQGEFPLNMEEYKSKTD